VILLSFGEYLVRIYFGKYGQKQLKTQTKNQ